MAFHLHPEQNPLNKEEEVLLLEKVKRGNKEERQRATDKIIEANLRLVFKIAHEFKRSAVPFEDLTSEGIAGLIYAVPRFDNTRDVRFSTYAGWWIRQRIRRCIESQSRTVRVPAAASLMKARLLQAKEELIATTGIDPTDDDLAEATGISKGVIKRVLASLSYGCSLDEDKSDDDERKQLELGTEDPIVETIDNTELSDSILHSMKRLSPREQFIVKMRFGFDGGPGATFEEIGQEVGRCKERCRQIHEEAMAKLRSKLKNKKMKKYLN